MRAILEQTLARFGFEVLTTGDAAELRLWAANRAADLVIADESVLDDGRLLPFLGKAAPDLPVVVTHAAAPAAPAQHDHPRLRARLAKPIDLKGLVALCEEAASETPALGGETEAIPLIGKSSTIQELYRAFLRLAQTDHPVLITGESGTGAELVARALHKFGKRRAGAFVSIDIPGLGDPQLSAFPDSAAPGEAAWSAIARARRGTLYLEEIADLSLDAQARLLRLLKEEIALTPVPSRIIASTRRDLAQLVAQGAFREDLFYRLNVVPLRLPPLRERLEDLPDIVDAVLKLAGEEGLPAPRIDASALECIKQYDWPGNILELSNFLRRIAVLYSSDVITAEMVRTELAREPRRPLQPKEIRPNELAPQKPSLAGAVEDYVSDMLRGANQSPPDLYDRLLREIETPLLRRVLLATRGNKLKAAEILGLNRNTLRKKLEKLGM
ncbi:sigma 54-interacting transcriptional regulator [Methylocystis parvus]|uniref:sigma 54-interacting transcriptional regulator n=1 Tax=Methylocystis parvus TaxID=134 RepID=UPI003C7260FE